MQKIYTADAPEAIGPYSQAVRTGSLLFTSGQIAIDPKPVDAHSSRPIHVIQKGASEGVAELRRLLTN